MNEKLRTAILNNNDLYRAVFKPLNIKSCRNDSIWYCLEEAPPFYSNLVTVSEHWKPDEIFQTIDKNFKDENRNEWSIKDSFAALDLSIYGFNKLFDANWIYLEAANFTPLKTAANLHFKVVKNEKDLSDWRIAWDSNEDLGKQIFHPDLLNDSKIHFVAGYKNENIECGCLLNETENILGISNFFAPEKTIEVWSETIEFVFDSIKAADIVGYERNPLTAKLKTFGFEAIGDLVVWLHKNNFS